VEKIQRRLLKNENFISELENCTSQVETDRENEIEKIAIHRTKVLSRVNLAAEELKLKLENEYDTFDLGLKSKRKVFQNENKYLSSVLESVANGNLNDKAYVTVQSILAKSSPDELLDLEKPSVHVSKTLSKVKMSDFGFLKVAKYLPKQFHLNLCSPFSIIASSKGVAKVVFNISTEGRFTEQVQANIKFSIKKKDCREPIPIIKEESYLDEELRNFKISFYAEHEGLYTVIVLLYDQHVIDSPYMVKVERSVEQLAERFAAVNTNGGLSECPIDDNNNCSKKVESPCPDEDIVEISERSPHHGHVNPVVNSVPEEPMDTAGCRGGVFMSGTRVFSIQDGTKEECLLKPIGMCLLLDGRFAVASTFENKVKIFSKEGKFLTEVYSPKASFDKPSDMVTLVSGRFVVRDNVQVQVFEANGSHVKSLLEDKGRAKYFGLAQDEEGNLVTIKESKRITELLFMCPESGEVFNAIDLGKFIIDKTNSKCRFLTHHAGLFYITDLGLDCIYIYNVATDNMKVFGTSGSEAGQLADPAGLAVGCDGNMIVADSKNHRICLFDKDGQYKCNLSLNPDVRRPSGVVLDEGNKELFVLTLHGRTALTKFLLN